MARFTWMCPVGLLCLVLAAACGGDDAPCTPESDAELCTQAGAECGATTVSDRCGGERVLACGGCEEPLSCGGGGEPNRCGATCAVGCPAGWTCEGVTCVGGSRTGIPLDVETVRVAGKVLLEGATPSVAEGCVDGATEVVFTERRTGAWAEAPVPCDPADFAFELELAPGVYEVAVRVDRSGGSTLPRGTFVIEPALAVEGPRADLALDVRTVPVAGRITLNGAAPRADLVDCVDHTVVVTFEETTSGTSARHAIPCDDADFSFEVRVPPGTYDIRAGKSWAEGSNLPDGSFALATALQVDGPRSDLAFDIATVEVAGRITWNGELPEAGVACSGGAAWVHFEDRATRAWTSAPVPCEAEDFGFLARVPPGTYEVSVSKGAPGDSNLPQGDFVVNPALRVDGPAEGLVLDVRSVPVSGTVRWSALSASSLCNRLVTSLYFASTENGGSVNRMLPCDPGLAFEAELAPGTYRVVLSTLRLGPSSLPEGDYVVSRELRVEGPVADLELELATVPVSGTVRVNGEAPAEDGACSGYAATVRLGEVREPSEGETTARAKVPCGAAEFAWSAEVPPGDYRVVVSPHRPGSGATLDPSFVAVDRMAVR